MIEPIDRKELKAWSIRQAMTATRKMEISSGSISTARAGSRCHGRAIVETLGNPDDQRKISLIAIHAHGIPDDFPAKPSSRKPSGEAATLEGRADLRAMPLITIDPPKMRAITTMPSMGRARYDPSNKGGYIVTVAIADVAHYVRPGSELDREAQKRGNSVYFPDRVVPMLPEEHLQRSVFAARGRGPPCLAVRMVFDKGRETAATNSCAAMMRSAAKLTYPQAKPPSTASRPKSPRR